MGELIDLEQHRWDRSRSTLRYGQAVFFFDLACPFSYLASERVERVLGAVEWVPVIGVGTARDGARTEAEGQARAARLPLVWPEPPPLAFPRATRVAAYAAHSGVAGPFALAAGRLAFCGGFYLDDPQILADAVTAAGLDPRECLAAAEDGSWDEQPHGTAAGLLRRGVRALPAIRLGGHWRYGMRALAEAAAHARHKSRADALSPAELPTGPY